ncbi:Olfactory receptor 14C36 [Sciurus carolinensis]|uniref:Olfactory receptor 14C36 n=1 Tax=Sciurus carolinensis TaxID=30640 RepID=A0AA41N0K5_SCICA|nr:Olfactory receptor 14C36 [Sciurus carolinensis]
MAIYTMVMEFILLGTPDGWNMNLLYFMLFIVTYLGTLFGNLLIGTVTTADQKQHMPTYFFLRNLFIFDMCFISITVPNACVNSINSNRAISVGGCETQILVLFCSCVELLFLSIMAWDCCVAICYPLQYSIITLFVFVFCIK